MNRSLYKAFRTRLGFFLIVYLVYFFLVPISDVFVGRSDFYALADVIVFSFLVLLMLAIIKTVKQKAYLHWCIVVISFLFVFTWGYDIQKSVEKWTLLTHLKESKLFFEDCAKKSQPVFEGGRLGVCEKKEYTMGKALGIDVVEVTEGILYDSSDQVLKRHAGRTQSWEKISCSLSSFRFGQPGYGYSVEKIVGPYYHIYFLSGLTPDFDCPDDPKVIKSKLQSFMRHKAG